MIMEYNGTREHLATTRGSSVRGIQQKLGSFSPPPPRLSETQSSTGNVALVSRRQWRIKKMLRFNSTQVHTPYP